MNDEERIAELEALLREARGWVDIDLGKDLRSRIDAALGPFDPDEPRLKIANGALEHIGPALAELLTEANAKIEEFNDAPAISLSYEQWRWLNGKPE
jgi:hypothetical protein